MCPPLDETSGLHGGDRGEGVAWRLEELGWERQDPYGYIYSVTASGRQVSTRPWRWQGNRTADSTDMAMPLHSEAYGGPLRDDQIADITSYLVAFESRLPDDQDAALEFVNELPERVSMSDAPEASPRPDGSDPIALGEWLFTEQACGTCHVLDGLSNPVPAQCPPLDDLTTVAAARIEDANYSGSATSALEYIAESITDPGAHIVEGYDAGIMPTAYRTALSAEELDALIAFLTGSTPGAESGEASETGDATAAELGGDASTTDQDADTDSGQAGGSAAGSGGGETAAQATALATAQASATPEPTPAP